MGDPDPTKAVQNSAEQEAEIEARRNASLQEGREELERQGINPDDYAKYFEIMRRNDIPLINELPTPRFLRDRGHVEKWLGVWASLKAMYDHIDLAEQDEVTGKEMIARMKELFEKFDTQYRAYADEVRASETFPRWPEELETIRKQIRELGGQYGRLPAYRAYRFYGRFMLDSLGRRQFQMDVE